MTERSTSSSISLPSLFLQFLSLPFMALLTNDPSNNDFRQHSPNTKRRKKQQKITKQPSSWDQIKNLLTCKQIQCSEIHDPSTTNYNHNMYTSCSSMRTLRNAVHSNTRVVHRSDNSPENGNSKKKSSRIIGSVNSSLVGSGAGGASYTGGRGGMQLRKLSGCYECHAIVDPSRCPLPRTTLFACSECGEVFPKTESLELHQAVRHAVSEIGPEDSSRNIVEIIFKSSWLKKDNPIYKIERILKIHNTQRTIQRFEDYRDAVRIRANSSANSSANKRNARCAADGNELLRFHCATLMCSLGARGSSSLCGSIPACSVCTIIQHGFHGGKPNGIRTTSSSGRAHDSLGDLVMRRAMLVCRVIAGRVKGKAEDASKDDGGAASPSRSSYDSVAGCAGIYSNLEELHVYSSRAILPCFVVIYKALDA